MSQSNPYVDRDGYVHQFLPNVSVKPKLKTITIQGRRYTLKPRAEGGFYIHGKGIKPWGAFCNVSLDDADLRQKVIEAILAHDASDRAASALVQERVKNGTAGLTK